MDNKSMSDRNGKVVEEKVPLRRADTLKKNRWRKSGTEMTSAVEIILESFKDLCPTRTVRGGRVTISDKGDSYLTTQDSQTSQNTTNTVRGLQRAQTNNQHTLYFVRVLAICDILRNVRPWTDFVS